MNILFLCHRLPFPPNKGEKIRAYHLLAHLAKHHTVHVGAFVDDPADLQYLDKVKEIAGGQCMVVPLTRMVARARMAGALLTGGPLTTSYFASAKLQTWVAELLRTQNIDSAVLFSTAMAPFLLGEKGLDPKRVILDMVDVDSDKWQQYAASSSGLYALIYRREARTLFALERKAATAFGGTLLVSPFEAKTFVDLAPELGDRVHSVPNGVDLAYFHPDRDLRNPFAEGEVPIVMTGTMDYRPNDEGALWFAQEVMPVIRATLPKARFYAVGARPTATLKRAAGDGVVVTGSVDDVRPYIAHAAAVVAPLHLARGVQNKVLEAMAMQKPVVATTPATRALAVERGENLWVADEVADFAKAVVAAASGPDRARIAANGRHHVEQHYDWASNLAKVDWLLDEAVRSGVDGRSHAASVTTHATAGTAVGREVPEAL